MQASSDLKDPHYVKIGEAFIYPRSLQMLHENNFVQLTINDDQLDFIQYVLKWLGLGVVMSNNNVDMSWNLALNFKNQ